MLKRAYSLIELKSVSEESDEWVITGMATTPTPDRYNDIVDPLGAEFKELIPLLWQHQASLPVGNTALGKPTKKGIPFTSRIPKVAEAGKLKDRIDEAVQSVKYGLVRAVSIGFRVLKDGMEFLDNGGIKFLKTEIMELSLVTIPANMEATIATVKSIDRDVRRAALGTGVRPTVRLDTKSAGVSASGSTNSVQEFKKVKISDQIKAFEAKRQAAAERMEALMTKAADETRVLETEEQDEYDGLNDTVEQVDAHLVRLRKLETSQVSKATPVTGVRSVEDGAAARASLDRHITVGDSLPKGLEFARYVRCLLLAKGDVMRAHEIAKSNFPDNTRVHSILKAAVAAGTTTDSTWAAPLVDYQTLAGEFIEFLRPQTILGKFGLGGVPSLRQIPFNVRMGRQTSGGSGYWVGEGKPKPLTKFDYEEVTLRWAKVANIAVLSEELVRFSNPSADLLVRQALADALRERMDIDFVDPGKAEVSNVSPASILNGVVGITSAGNTSANARTDIQELMQAFIDNNLTPTNGVFIMGTANALALSMMQNALGQAVFPNITMNGGTLSGLPVITSEYISQLSDSSGSPVILVNASDVFLADDGVVTIDASREASLQMLDNPTNDVTGATVATSMISMFQTNSVALRAERVINWKKRRAAAAAYISQAAYNSAS
jgi:HK97 family phage major capsid protein/HK97 family phage prohead protease